VNFGGSSGYGRAYRDRLASGWGVVDVRDCIEVAKILSDSTQTQLLDPKRIVIRGGSSGGYTVLAALSTVKAADLGVFAAGTSSYGISDLRKLVEDTHKFESKYMETLVGGMPKEVPDVYIERSPIEHADKIVRPLLVRATSCQ
jgi:dipeptidyl aminopeptidase/acylaminoacyl peptidase